MASGKKIVTTEHAEQVALCRWLRARGVLFFAVPNGADLKSPRAAARLKAEGLTPGVADLIIPRPGGAVAVELKRRRGGRLSSTQRDWGEAIQKVDGWVYLVAHGAADAIRQLEEVLYGKA